MLGNVDYDSGMDINMGVDGCCKLAGGAMRRIVFLSSLGRTCT
jgi:hypothetical protein